MQITTRFISAKCIYVFKIFTNIGDDDRSIGNQSLILYPLAFIILNLIIFGIAVLVPKGYKGLEPQIVGSTVNVLYEYYACNSSDQPFTNIVMYIGFAINGVVLFFNFVLYTISRKVKTSYSESSYLRIIVREY